MLRTAEQIACIIGVETQSVTDFLNAHKIRASRQEGQAKYYDEATQCYIRMQVELINRENRQ